jgi:pimeloyl-ACP methyl ester carboxylesterase
LRSHTMELPDGRVLSWAEFGADSSANVLVHQHGTGSSRLEVAMYDQVIADIGMRVIAPERPGYGASTGGEHPRVVGDWPNDVACLMRRLNLDEFAVSGYSGGGPHALAIAASAELGSSVTRVLLRAALAPNQPPRNAYDSEIQARAHRISWDDFLGWFDPSADPPEFAPADVEAFSDPVYNEAAMSTLAEGAQQGLLGVVGDHWAFAGHWGFEVKEVGQPVHVWHGDADTRVPVSHAHVLRSLLPSAEIRILAAEGHYSIGRHFPDQVELAADRGG